jgi:hypothetical protein
MKRRTARLLRRLADKLAPIPPPQMLITYNGKPVDMEKTVVTALTNHARRNGVRGIA